MPTLSADQLDAYRIAVRATTPCPECGADVGQRCRSRRVGGGWRVSNHRERNTTAHEAGSVGIGPSGPITHPTVLAAASGAQNGCTCGSCDDGWVYVDDGRYSAARPCPSSAFAASWGSS